MQNPFGCGSKWAHQKTAASSPCFLLQGFHFGYLFLTHSHFAPIHSLAAYLSSHLAPSWEAAGSRRRERAGAVVRHAKAPGVGGGAVDGSNAPTLVGVWGGSSGLLPLCRKLVGDIPVLVVGFYTMTGAGFYPPKREGVKGLRGEERWT